MRILLSAAYSIIEPLGLSYLAGLAKKLGHQTRIVLVRDFDFRPLFERVEEFRPDLVGFNVYTGAHKPVFAAIERLNRIGICTVMGGPHATYFAEDAARFARHVVRGEGFTMFRQILEGRAPQGVLFDGKLLREGFPFPDRATFYNDHPRHRENPISRIPSARSAARLPARTAITCSTTLCTAASGSFCGRSKIWSRNSKRSASAGRPG